MPNKVKVEISGDHELLAQYIFEESATGKRWVRNNVRTATFNADVGVKYVLIAEVIGAPSEVGKKFKLSVSGATKATYPSRQKTYKGGRVFLAARITG